MYPSRRSFSSARATAALAISELMQSANHQALGKGAPTKSLHQLFRRHGSEGEVAGSQVTAYYWHLKTLMRILEYENEWAASFAYNLYDNRANA